MGTISNGERQKAGVRISKAEVSLRPYPSSHSFCELFYKAWADGRQHRTPDFLALSSADAVFGFEIGIQRMKHFFGDRAGYNLSLGLSGYGQTEEQAAQSYWVGAEQTAKAFIKLSRLLSVASSTPA